jgi:hypothetical protein
MSDGALGDADKDGRSKNISLLPYRILEISLHYKEYFYVFGSNPGSAVFPLPHRLGGDPTLITSRPDCEIMRWPGHFGSQSGQARWFRHLDRRPVVAAARRAIRQVAFRLSYNILTDERRLVFKCPHVPGGTFQWRFRHPRMS